MRAECPPRAAPARYASGFNVGDRRVRRSRSQPGFHLLSDSPHETAQRLQDQAVGGIHAIAKTPR